MADAYPGVVVGALVKKKWVGSGWFTGAIDEVDEAEGEAQRPLAHEAFSSLEMFFGGGGEDVDRRCW